MNIDHKILFKESLKDTVSIVVPVINDLDNLIKLLDSLLSQKFLPSEIIISDSSSGDQIELYIQDLSYPIPVIYLRVGRSYRGDKLLHFLSNLLPAKWSPQNLKQGRAYPYEATNKGALVAKGHWLAFLDSTTIPEENWLHDYISSAKRNHFDLVFGKTKYFAKTYYQKIFRAATWGAIGHESMPGTIIKNEIYFKIQEGVRAGGDVEWRNKAKALFRWNTPQGYCLSYFNIPTNPVSSSKKMFIYQLHATRIDIQHTVKDIYLGLFLLLSVIVIPKWNFIVGWDSPYFIPNITKIYLVSFCAILIVALIVNRGILRTMRKHAFIFNILRLMVFVISIICIFRWNAVIAGWVEESIWFIPHITKIYISLIFLVAFLYRGLYLPITHDIKSTFLFPFNFIIIGVLGIFNDLVKAPGYLLGAILSSFIRK